MNLGHVRVHGRHLGLLWGRVLMLCQLTSWGEVESLDCCFRSATLRLQPIRNAMPTLFSSFALICNASMQVVIFLSSHCTFTESCESSSYFLCHAQRCTRCLSSVTSASQDFFCTEPHLLSHSFHGFQTSWSHRWMSPSYN